MYYICKFRTAWSIFDDIGQSDQTLEADDIERVKKYFSGILEEAKILTGLQILALPSNKRIPAIETQQFLISKLFTKWVVFDGNTQTDRWLDTAEITWLKKLIPELVSPAEHTINLLATAIQPSKLLQLSLGGSTAAQIKTIPKTA